MHSRSFYDAIARNIEDGGGSPAPADQTAGHSSAPAEGSTSPDTGADTSTNDTGNEPPPLQEQLSKIWDNAHTPRDERGRFQPRNPQDKQEVDDLDDDLDDDLKADAEDGAQNAPTDPDDDLDDDLSAGDEKADGSQDATTDKPPQSWSKADQEAWKALPANVKALIHKREADIAQVIGRAGNAVKALKDNQPILQGVEPYKQYLAQREQMTGVPAGKLVNDVLRFAYSFDTAQSNDQKLGILEEIVGSFGIDLSPWIGRDAAEALRGARSSDPRVEQLTQVVADLQAQLQQRSQQEQAQAEQALVSAIDAFSQNTKDFPYFRHVRNQMGALIGALDPHDDRPVETLLKEAYETACWAHPKVRARLLRDQQRQTQESHLRQVSKKADNARKAAAVNVKGGVPSPSKRSMSDDIRATADKFYR